MLVQVILTTLEIPPKKFGGAERIVHFLDDIFKKNNQPSKVISSDNIEKIFNDLDSLILLNPIIICHSDWITFDIAVRYKNFKIFHYSHYPYAETASAFLNKKFPQLFFINPINSLRVWKYLFKYCSQIIRLNFFCKNVIFLCLSKKIFNNLKNIINVNRLFYFPNPIITKDVSSFSVKRRNNKFLCVGKIEHRKNQAELQKLIPKGLVNYIGPKGTSNFDFNSIDYLGEVSHSRLEKMYRSCKGLILASSGEAMPQVLFEALSRGLPIFCTKEAAWDFVRSDSIYIFEDTNSLAIYIKSNPTIPSKAYINAYSEVSILADPKRYFKEYVRPLFNEKII
jgi:hypothetical protein